MYKTIQVNTLKNKEIFQCIKPSQVRPTNSVQMQTSLKLTQLKIRVKIRREKKSWMDLKDNFINL